MGDDVYKRSREGIVKVNRDGSKTVAYKSKFGKEFQYQRNPFQNETLSRESEELRRNDSSVAKTAEAPTVERAQTLHSVRQQSGDYLERARSRDIPEPTFNEMSETLPPVGTNQIQYQNARMAPQKNRVSILNQQSSIYSQHGTTKHNQNAVTSSQIVDPDTAGFISQSALVSGHASKQTPNLSGANHSDQATDLVTETALKDATSAAAVRAHIKQNQRSQRNQNPGVPNTSLHNREPPKTELQESDVLSRKFTSEPAVSRSSFSKSGTDHFTSSKANMGKGIGETVSAGASHVFHTGSGAAQRGISFVQTSATGESDQDVGDKSKQYLVSGSKDVAGKVKDTGVKAVKKAGGKTAKTIRHKVQKQAEKTAVKAGQKAAAKTTQATARAVERAAAKAAQTAAKTAAQAAAHTATTTVRTTATLTQVIVSNPITLCVAGVLLFLILMCSLGAMMGGTGLITQRLDPSYNMPWYELRQYISTLETQALQDAEQSLRDEVERINAGGYTPPNVTTPADGSLWYVTVMSLDGTTNLRQVQQIIRLMVGCCFSNLNFVEGGDNYDEKKAFIDKLYGSWGENQNDGILWSWKPYIYDTGAIDANGLHQYKVMYCISINDLGTIKSRVGIGLSNEGSMMTTEQWNTFADAYGAYDWWAQQDLDQFWNDEVGDPIYSDETTVTGTFILDTRTSYYGDDKIVAGSFGATIKEQDYLDPSVNVGQDALDYEQQITREPNGTEHHTHNGIDLVSNPGVHVVSATDGTVVAVGKENSYSGLAEQDHGNYVTILCQDNIMMTYSHLDEVAVEVGQSVSVASYLGTVGRSGKISPTIEAAIDNYVERLYNNGQWYVDESMSGGDKWGYVHFEVTINGYYANPNEYMGLGELGYPDN